MTLTQALFGLLDTRSFSSLWYWILLAAVWRAAEHRVLGVPYGMVLQARRGGAAAEDLRDLLRVNVSRLSAAREGGGPFVAGAAAFGLTTLGLLGFVHGIEFCQAVFLMLFPLSLVALLRLRAAVRLAPLLAVRGSDAAALAQRLVRHRRQVQLVGTATIILTVLWGMMRNLGIPLLG